MSRQLVHLGVGVCSFSHPTYRTTPWKIVYVKQCGNQSKNRIDNASSCGDYILMLIKANWSNAQ
jgi:hypothetical protein